MKRQSALPLLALLALVIAPFAWADDAAPIVQPKPFEKVDAKYVCMVNNMVFPKAQIPVEVEGKTYYGCCAMCKERLSQDQAARTAQDPVSGKTVDKATAYILVADQELNVLYFENEANAKKYVDDHKAKAGA